MKWKKIMAQGQREISFCTWTVVLGNFTQSLFLSFSFHSDPLEGLQRDLSTPFQFKGIITWFACWTKDTLVSKGNLIFIPRTVKTF